MIGVEDSPGKTTADVFGMCQSLDDQRGSHMLCQSKASTFTRVNINGGGQIHILPAFTRQVRDIAHIDVVGPEDVKLRLTKSGMTRWPGARLVVTHRRFLLKPFKFIAFMIRTTLL